MSSSVATRPARRVLPLHSCAVLPRLHRAPLLLLKDALGCDFNESLEFEISSGQLRPERRRAGSRAVNADRAGLALDRERAWVFVGVERTVQPCSGLEVAYALHTSACEPHRCVWPERQMGPHTLNGADEHDLVLFTL